MDSYQQVWQAGEPAWAETAVSHKQVFDYFTSCSQLVTVLHAYNIDRSLHPRQQLTRNTVSKAIFFQNVSKSPSSVFAHRTVLIWTILLCDFTIMPAGIWTKGLQLVGERCTNALTYWWNNGDRPSKRSRDLLITHADFVWACLSRIPTDASQHYAHARRVNSYVASHWLTVNQ